ncbi:MAG TPA: polysaccharide lyase family protein [Bryobacteraceae bacterium]|nr:polysaccharide lyase family protein [Bryobacteraceae bacterium]
MRFRILSPAGLALFSLAAGTLALSAQENTVWHIGNFDHTAAEFAGQVRNQPVVVDADAPDAARRWPASQAGTLNAHSGPQSHSRTIQFRLNEAPRGSFVLDFAILAGNPRTPHLELDLNGTPATAYLDRRLSYHAEGRADSPICAEARVRIPVPASVLRQGGNTLRITAVDDEPDENGDSQISWDAIALTRSEGVPGEAAVSVEPAYFFANRNGILRELVTETVTSSETVSSGTLTLSLAGAAYRADLAAARFGQQRFEFWVPEFRAGAEARAAVALNGKTYQRVERLTPKRKLTVYIVPHTHLDIGFTDYQPKIEELQNRNLDRLLEEMRGDPDMRFSLDGAWLAEQYLRTRSPAAQRELLEAVRAGRISIPAQYANLMAGGAGLETLIRSLYAGQALNRQAGREADYANITDVPAYPWAYASVLSAAGVKYFAAGANDDRGPQPLYGRWQTRSPFWWQGPDGAKVLMAYTRQYSNLWFICGLPPGEAACRESLPVFFQTFESPGYQPDVVLMFGSQLENTDLIPGEGKFVRGWNATYAWPRLQLATFRDYFELIQKQYGDKLETVRGDFGPYWEDGIGTDAQYAALYRQTESRAAAVETLSSLAAAQRPEWAPPLDQLRRLWQDLILYAEHTYTSSGGYSRPESEQSVRQIETKHFHVTDARETAHWIAQESISRLLECIRIVAPAVVVFNSLAHERSGLVEMDLSNGLALVEAGGQPMAVETVRAGPGYRRVRFLAEHVPAMGYRVYRLENRQAGNPAAAAKPGNVIENAFYRVTVDPARGGISSILDKQAGRELVDRKSPYLLDQYLYVSGGEGTRLIHITEHLPAANLTVSPSGGATAVSTTPTPWGSSLRYQVSGPHAPEIAVEVRLFDGQKKIEIVNRVKKEPVSDKEAVYFAFPFAAPDPQFEYEGQTGTVNPARDELAGGCREWYAAGHWARVSGGGVSAAVIPLDAPLVTFGDINRGLWPQKFEPRSSAIFSYALNNYWHTNFPRVQSGDFRFDYVLTSGSELNPAALSRLGREELTPLELGELTRNDKVGIRGSLPDTAGSFLSLDGEGVEMETLKPAEDGDGYIVRLLETAGRAGKARLSAGLLPIDRAWLCDAAERNQREIAVQKEGLEVATPPYSIVSLRLRLRK